VMVLVFDTMKIVSHKGQRAGVLPLWPHLPHCGRTFFNVPVPWIRHDENRVPQGATCRWSSNGGRTCPIVAARFSTCRCLGYDTMKIVSHLGQRAGARIRHGEIGLIQAGCGPADIIERQCFDHGRMASGRCVPYSE